MASNSAFSPDVEGSVPPPAKRSRLEQPGTPSASTTSATAPTSSSASGGGHSVATSSSAAPTDDAGAPASATTSHFKPACVLVKIGDGQYTDVEMEWTALADLRRGAFLDALSTTRVFGPSLKDVELAKCTVSILKGELPEEVEVPLSTDDVQPSAFVELVGAATLEKAVQKAGCSGDRLFIRVLLPGAAVAQTSASQGKSGSHIVPVQLAFSPMYVASLESASLRIHPLALPGVG